MAGVYRSRRGDGKEIFYLTPDKKLMAASVGATPVLHAGPSHALFQTRITGVARNHYTVSADGQRSLISSPRADATMSPINVVMNWTALLHQ